MPLFCRRKRQRQIAASANQNDCPTMKISALALLFVSVGAFQQPSVPRHPTHLSVKQAKKKASSSWLDSFLDFKPFHGHGSGEHQEQAMYAEQQSVLKERRKMELKKKYKNPQVDHLKDIPVHQHDPAMLNKMEDDAMYVDENDKGFQFPFFNPKLKP